MHGCSSESAFLVNAEVDSMGGVIDGVVGIGIMTSPCRAEIERAQEEIRLEIDSREERLRELEFLEKGGDPLDFKSSQAVSVSVQSTSLTDQHPEQIVTSKAKDSYASAALRPQHGEAAESIGKPGDTTCEANSGDNLLLFDDEKKLDKDKNFKARSGQNTAAPSVISSRTVGNHKAKGSESSAIFRPYARRNRSKSNRDGARSASMDVSHARNQGYAQFRNGTRDAKGLLSDANRKDQKLSSFCKLKSSNRIHEMEHKNDTINNVESVVMPTADKLTNVVHGSRKEHSLDVKTNGDLLGSRKDHEKSQDATSCGAGIEAHETKVLANCGSFLSDATRSTLQTGVGSQPDVAVSKTINSTHPDSTLVNLDIHSPIHDSVSCAKLVNEDPNELHKDPFLVADEARKPLIEDPLEINIDPNPIDPGSVVIGGDSVHQDTKSSSVIKVEEDVDLQNKSVASESLKMTELKDLKELEALKNQDNVIDYFSSPRNGDRAEVQTSTTSLTDKDVPDAACERKLTDKTDEDSILAEAKIIQAKRRRIAELSMRSLPSKNCQKSHWDFLLEEVAWLANDFMQERLWKVKTAAQLGRHTALASHIRDQKQMPVQRLRFVAHSLAKAVMEFWQTSEMPDGPDSLEPQSPHKSFALKSYALRFMKYNSSTLPYIKVEDPVAPNDMHDLGMQQTSGESCITNYLFYAIPPGAMQCYRTSIESYVLQCEKNGSMQREDVSQINGANEEMSLDKVYDEDEGETSTHCLPGTVEWSKASQLPHKKQKGLKRTYSSASYELGADFANGSHMPGTQKSVLMVKQPSSQNHGSIPTKRMRTASRQRMLGSHSGTSTVKMLAMNMTGASSEDTNSYQDDQSSLHFGSQLQRSLEVESPIDYEKYLPTDSGEISTKHKKKKVDHFKRRLDRHHLDSNGSNGLFGQHRNKKFKLSKQTFEHVLDNGAPISGSMPSPASQMSNMANANEYKKIIANGDRFKKTKGTKLPIPMHGSGNAWTLFEDQALVVLVHDLGPNWYLVSDALNSTLRLKHIFREPKDCKERHKVLMDQTAGDGADSADDSGSSQPYPSTMPGIPKGSARQLFQRLRGPIEEDMVKSHFERIIMIGQKQHHHRKHCDFRDQKHVIPPHNSHVIAISQVSSNNVNGGFLTPLDLIDAIMSSPDALGYQCPQTNGFTNQSCGTSAPSPHDMPVGNSLSSPSGPLSHRNGRYGVSVTSLPVDDQQRIQQLNPLLAGRNIQQSTIPIPGPRPLADRFGPRKLQGGNGMGMVNGINNRGNPMSRPGFQGLGSGALLSSGMVGMQGLEMQSVISSSQGNSMQRPMDNSHQIRPGQSLEHPRQKMAPEMQMRAAQANNQCITPINGLNGSYTGQTVPSSGTSYSFHPQQKHQQPNDLTNPRHSHLKVPNHAVGSQHPAYARLAKERQLQQQMFQQQQQQYSASNATMTQAQPQPQLPVSMQNNLQVQPQSSQGFSHSSLTPASSATPIYSQLHQKHHLPPHGNVRDSQSSTSSLPNQITKQGQRHPQQQQSFRPHTAQHRQQLQSQPGKQFKSEVKGNMNVTVDQSNLNGQSLSPSPGGQSTDKEEHAVLVQGSQNSGQPSRSLGLNVSSQNLLQHPPNQMQQVAPLDNGNLGVPHQATSSNLVSSPNYPPIQVPSSSHLNHVGQNQVNIPRGPENPHLVSQLDDQTVNSDVQSVGSAAMLQGWQAPDSLQNACSQLPGNDSSLVGPGSIRKHLSGDVVSSANSVGDRWQEKSQVPNPLAPSTSQQQE